MTKFLLNVYAKTEQEFKNALIRMRGVIERRGAKGFETVKKYDGFERALVTVKGTKYIASVEETWGGGVWVRLTESPVGPGEIGYTPPCLPCEVELKKSHLATEVRFTEQVDLASWLKKAALLGVKEDRTALACMAMGVDY